VNSEEPVSSDLTWSAAASLEIRTLPGPDTYTTDESPTGAANLNIMMVPDTTAGAAAEPRPSGAATLMINLVEPDVRRGRPRNAGHQHTHIRRRLREAIEVEAARVPPANAKVIDEEITQITSRRRS
jgi:hypothetical protein